VMNKTTLGENISFVGFWGVNRLLGLGQTKTEVRENVRKFYSKESNPFMRHATLQANAMMIGVLGILLGMLAGIFALILGSHYSQLIIWFIIVVPLPLVLLSTYFYIRLIPIDRESTRWEEGGQSDTDYAKNSHMFYDIEYYLGFIIALIISLVFVPMILNA